MLWTDSLFVSSSDMSSLDIDVATTLAATEGLTVDGTNGLIHRTIEQAGFRLLAGNQNFMGLPMGGGVSVNHSMAVFNVGSPASQRPIITLQNVVVNGQNTYTWSALKTWVVYECLARFFMAAENQNQKTDRYTRKKEEYSHHAKWCAWPMLVANGLPVVYKPLSCPGAFFDHDAGVWGASSVASSGTDAGVFSVALSYVDSTQPENNESSLSALLQVSVATNEVIQVDISGLHPPTGNVFPQDVASAYITPLTATHYNVYVGPPAVAGQAARLWKQNTSPIPITDDQWALTGNPVFSGILNGLGQWADLNVTMPRVRPRG